MQSVPEIGSGSKCVVFLLGCGGAGKSTFRQQHFPALPTVDPDDFLPDPLRPTEGRAIAQAKAEALRQDLLAHGESFVRDTTGTNTGRMAREMKECQARGYSVVLIYVDTNFVKCLERNRSRPRVVPEEVILADVAYVHHTVS